MIVCKYGILMTLLWLKKIELLHIKYKSYFPCMYPNIFFNISCTGLDLYLIQTIRPLKVHLCHSIQTGLYLTCG
jgi:hypothetical protein